MSAAVNNSYVRTHEWPLHAYHDPGELGQDSAGENGRDEPLKMWQVVRIGREYAGDACLIPLSERFASVGAKQTIRRLEMPADGTGDVEASPGGRRAEELVRMV
jgi:hypothetical protein